MNKWILYAIQIILGVIAAVISFWFPFFVHPILTLIIIATAFILFFATKYKLGPVVFLVAFLAILAYLFYSLENSNPFT